MNNLIEIGCLLIITLVSIIYFAHHEKKAKEKVIEDIVTNLDNEIKSNVYMETTFAKVENIEIVYTKDDVKKICHLFIPNYNYDFYFELDENTKEIEREFNLGQECYYELKIEFCSVEYHMSDKYVRLLRCRPFYKRNGIMMALLVPYDELPLKVMKYSGDAKKLCDLKNTKEYLKRTIISSIQKS